MRFFQILRVCDPPKHSTCPTSCRSFGVPHFPASVLPFFAVSTPHNRRCSAARITSTRRFDRYPRRHRRGIVLDVAGQRYSFHTSCRRWHPQFAHRASFPESHSSSTYYVVRCFRSAADITLPGLAALVCLRPCFLRSYNLYLSGRGSINNQHFRPVQPTSRSQQHPSFRSHQYLAWRVSN